MPIEMEDRNDTRVIALRGDVSIDDSLQFARAMKDTVAGVCDTVVVVLATPMINSHCLGTVLATYNALRATSKKIKVVCNESSVLKSLTVFRILPRIEVYATVQEAMADDQPGTA